MINWMTCLSIFSCLSIIQLDDMFVNFFVFVNDQLDDMFVNFFVFVNYSIG